MEAAAHALQQPAEIGVAVSETFPLKVKMVMAKLVLDDLLDFFASERQVVSPADLDVMRAGEIPAAGRRQAAVEHGAVTERFAEAVERNAFYPLLQFLVGQTKSPVLSVPIGCVQKTAASPRSASRDCRKPAARRVGGSHLDLKPPVVFVYTGSEITRSIRRKGDDTPMPVMRYHIFQIGERLEFVEMPADYAYQLTALNRRLEKEIGKLTAPNVPQLAHIVAECDNLELIDDSRRIVSGLEYVERLEREFAAVRETVYPLISLLTEIRALKAQLEHWREETGEDG